MLKRISVSDLRLDMYLADLCGSWMDHPFWRTRFRIVNPRQIDRLRSSGITEVWIDTDRGVDVAAPEAATASVEQVADDVDACLAASVDELPVAPARVELAVEVENAAGIHRRSRPAVEGLFREARLGRIADTAQALPVVEEITDSVTRNPGALIGLARLKRIDDYTYMHSMSVCAMMVALARHLGCSDAQVREAGLAGLLHDVGKIAIPDRVLNKPGALDDAEWLQMRQHPQLGFEMLAEARGATASALDVVLHHHEKFDGSGYPHRQAGDGIELLSRMGAVCDVYDAITSERPYKRGWQPAIAVRKMAEWRGHFDQSVFQAFVKAIGIYPVGSTVRLQSQRLALVVEHDSERLLKPVVKVFYSLERRAPIVPFLLDLGDDASGDRIVGREDPASHGLQGIDELWAGSAGTT